MSIQFQQPVRMPQPEQWLSEHPVLVASIFAAILCALLWVLL